MAEMRKTERERFEDAILITLKMEKEGVINQGMQEVSRSWKGQGNGYFPIASRKNLAQLTP